MNRKLLKPLGLVLALSMMAAGVAGCGGGTPPESSAPADGGAPAGSDAPAGGELIIGGMGPLTGDNASYGISVRNGAQIAIDEINAAGGINGMTVRMEFADDVADPETAMKAYNQLMDKGMQVFLGNVTSGACIAVTDLTKEDNILQITPSGSALACTQYDNAFRICFTDPLQGVTMADYAVDVLGYKKAAVISDISNDYSTGMANAFVEEMKAKGGEVVANESFTSGDVDFNTQLTKIKESGADFIFVPTYYKEAAYITSQAQKLGMELPFLGGDGWDGVLDQMGEDASAVEGATFLTPFAANEQTELVQNFVKAYEAAYGATPDQFAADAYDGIYVIKAAVEQAGSVDTDALIAAMTQIQVNGLTGDMTFTPEGEPNKVAKVVQIVNGEYVIKTAA